VHKTEVYHDAKYQTGVLRKQAKRGLAFTEQPPQSGKGDRVSIGYGKSGDTTITRAGDTIRTLIVQAMNNCAPAILAEAVKLAQAAEWRAAHAAEDEAREVLDTIEKGREAAK